MSLEDFEINLLEDGKIIVNYVGKDEKIDKCNCILHPKFATHHLVKVLLDKIGVK